VSWAVDAHSLVLQCTRYCQLAQTNVVYVRILPRLRLHATMAKSPSECVLRAFSRGSVTNSRRGTVIGKYEKKGHRFVELDALVVANGKTPLAHCWHIAIYQPREQAKFDDRSGRGGSI